MKNDKIQPFLRLSKGTIILASASITRQNILSAAGVGFHIWSPSVDEETVRVAAEAENIEVAEIAILLSELKAKAAFQFFAGQTLNSTDLYILGCDQVLVFQDKLISKPVSLKAAKEQLYLLMGKRHQLLTAIVLTLNGERIWHHLGSASLTMRDMDKSFINFYINHLGNKALLSPGGYQIEGIGATLFDKIEGDYFDILGLPLLPLLAILRKHGLGPNTDSK